MVPSFGIYPTELPEGRIPLDRPAQVPERAERCPCCGGEQPDRRQRQILHVLLLPTVRWWRFNSFLMILHLHSHVKAAPYKHDTSLKRKRCYGLNSTSLIPRLAILLLIWQLATCSVTTNHCSCRKMQWVFPSSTRGLITEKCLSILVLF